MELRINRVRINRSRPVLNLAANDIDPFVSTIYNTIHCRNQIYLICKHLSNKQFESFKLDVAIWILWVFSDGFELFGFYEFFGWVWVWNTADFLIGIFHSVWILLEWSAHSTHTAIMQIGWIPNTNQSKLFTHLQKLVCFREAAQECLWISILHLVEALSSTATIVFAPSGSK